MLLTLRVCDWRLFRTCSSTTNSLGWKCERKRVKRLSLVCSANWRFLSVPLQCGWYWGPMNWEDAEMKLKGKPDGSFLVRDSSDPRYILSLSFRSQGVTHHTRMEHYRGEMHYFCTLVTATQSRVPDRNRTGEQVMDVTISSQTTWSFLENHTSWLQNQTQKSSF